MTLLWLFALKQVVITQGDGVTLAGSAFILLAVSFIVGIAWAGKTGLLMFGALMAIAVFESLKLNRLVTGFAYDLAEGVQLQPTGPNALESEFVLYLSCIAYFYFGRRVSLALPSAEGAGRREARNSDKPHPQAQKR